MSQLSFFGVSHLDYPTTSLHRAATFLATFGWFEKKRGDGFVDLDAHSCAVRVIEVPKVSQPVTLRLQVSDVDLAVKAACDAGAILRYEKFRTADQEWQAQVEDQDGNTIFLWRDCTEDELDFVPELPKEMSWSADAEVLLKSLLGHVPALFRGLARRRVTKTAEFLAGGRKLVTREEVIRAYILSSPKVTRERNRAPLVAAGVDVSRYQADFDAD